MHAPSNCIAPAVFASLLAGCAASDAPSSGLPGASSGPLFFLPATDVAVPCPSCYEPAVAIDAQNRIYVASYRLGGRPTTDVKAGVAVSTDGGRTFAVKPVPRPDLALPIGGGIGDDLVQAAPWGTLYFTEIWSEGRGSSSTAGINFAASDDGGDTWPIHHYFYLGKMPASRQVESDRQWLAFDGDSTIYLVLNCAASLEICLMRSDDRGRTWSTPPTTVVTALDHSFPSPEGAPAVGPDHALIVPYFSDVQPDPVAVVGARTIRVAASTDGGQTFTQHTVYTHPLGQGVAGGGWPEATILNDNSWVAGWGPSDGSLWLSRSTDHGATWSDPTMISAQDNGGNVSHPWLLPRADGGLDAVWFTAEPAVRLGRFSADLKLLDLAKVNEPGGGQSDYPYFTHLPGDRVAVPFITPGTPDVGLKLAITNR